MRGDQERGSAARAPIPDDMSNPYAPIDFTTRLKAPLKRAETPHIIKPLQPGQPYGAEACISPPKPLYSQTPPAEGASAWRASGFSQPAPFGANDAYGTPARAGPVVPPKPPRAETCGLSTASGLPPYLQNRPAAAHASKKTRAARYGVLEDAQTTAAVPAPNFNQQTPAEGADASASFVVPRDAESSPAIAAPRTRRRRTDRYAKNERETSLAEKPVPRDLSEADMAPETSGAAPAPFEDHAQDPLPDRPFIPVQAPCPPLAAYPAGDGAAVFPPEGWPGASYDSPFEPDEPYRPEPAMPYPSPLDWDSVQPVDEIAAFFGDEPSPVPQANMPVQTASPLRDPFTPTPTSSAPGASAPVRSGEAKSPRRSKLRHATARAQKPPPARREEPRHSQRPPVRPARVAALIASFVMLVFCGVEGGRILSDLARNEREMESVRKDFRQRMGVELQNGSSRVDLLPAGQTFEPTATSTPTSPVQTPTSTPVIPIRENAVQSLNKRDNSNVQETPAPTATPSPRTRLTEYPGNPLRNVMESLSSLIQENGDVVGRLTIPGVLDEVVVQRNNTYYLTHNHRGSSSDAGAVFADESCSLRYPPENLLLRGQSAVPGKVFAPLWQYATAGREFVSSATAATLTTLYEQADYVLFAVIVADSDPASDGYFNYASHPSFSTDESMLAYVEAARSHSLYQFNVDVQASDRLLTLATVGGGDECLVLLFRQMR